MRAHRIFSILFLLIANWSLPLRAQEPANKPADFRTTFDSDRPLLPIRDKDNRMLPPGLATVTIEALNASGERMAGFSGSVKIQGAWRDGKKIETAGPPVAQCQPAWRYEDTVEFGHEQLLLPPCVVGAHRPRSGGQVLHLICLMTVVHEPPRHFLQFTLARTASQSHSASHAFLM
jgi:hypothetical protein